MTGETFEDGGDRIPKNRLNSLLGVKEGPPRGALDLVSTSDLLAIMDRLREGQWVSQAALLRMGKSYTLSCGALAGAVARGWALALDVEAGGDKKSADQLREWCRLMRRVLPDGMPGLPKMEAP